MKNFRSLKKAINKMVLEANNKDSMCFLTKLDTSGNLNCTMLLGKSDVLRAQAASYLADGFGELGGDCSQN